MKCHSTKHNIETFEKGFNDQILQEWILASPHYIPPSNEKATIKTKPNRQIDLFAKKS